MGDANRPLSPWASPVLGAAANPDPVPQLLDDVAPHPVLVQLPMPAGPVDAIVVPAVEAVVLRHVQDGFWACDECGDEFSLRSNLLQHACWYDDAHPFRCGKCGITFEAQYILERHIESHKKRRDRLAFLRATAVEEAPIAVQEDGLVECPICGLKYTGERGLRIHRARVVCHRKPAPVERKRGRPCLPLPSPPTKQ